MNKEQLTSLVNQKKSIRQISAEMGLSYSTIRYWLGRYGLKTQAKGGQIPRDAEGSPVYSVIIRECSYHGLTEFGYEVSKRGYRCKRCRSQRVNDKRRALKAEALALLGGRCSCGYDKSSWALEFHHRDSDQKEREIGDLIRDRKREPLLQEIMKCDLVCSNCHAEIEEKKWIAANGRDK